MRFILLTFLLALPFTVSAFDVLWSDQDFISNQTHVTQLSDGILFEPTGSALTPGTTYTNQIFFDSDLFPTTATSGDEWIFTYSHDTIGCHTTNSNNYLRWYWTDGVVGSSNIALSPTGDAQSTSTDLVNVRTNDNVIASYIRVRWRDCSASNYYKIEDIKYNGESLFYPQVATSTSDQRVYNIGMPATTTCIHTTTSTVCTTVQSDVLATNDFGLVLGLALILGLGTVSFLTYVFYSRHS